MERGAVPTQRAKSSVLKLLQHRIVPTRFLGEAFNNRSGHALAQGFRDRAERGPTTEPATGPSRGANSLAMPSRLVT